MSITREKTLEELNLDLQNKKTRLETLKIRQENERNKLSNKLFSKFRGETPPDPAIKNEILQLEKEIPALQIEINNKTTFLDEVKSTISAVEQKVGGFIDSGKRAVIDFFTTEEDILKEHEENKQENAVRAAESKARRKEWAEKYGLRPR
jgi:hypothetical protein